MTNQIARVLEYIKKHGSITTMDAFMDLGITRLGSRIWDLRHLGHDIHDEYVKGKNRFGEPIYYKKYFFASGENKSEIEKR